MYKLLPLKLVFAIMLAACVTVNVYFPAAAAEQAADRIIDAVTSGAGSGTASPPAEHAVPTSQNRNPVAPRNVLVAALGCALNFLIPTAQAQNAANLDLSTPEIRAVTASMQQRFAQLQKYFASGAIGLTANGMIQIRDQNVVPLAERATVKTLVTEDNRDRATLYSEIAKANGHPEWDGDIRKTFARRWVERGAQAGWYYQNSAGTWTQK